MEELERQGEWWLPCTDENDIYDIPDKENRVGGELTYTPNQGGTLNLFGTIGNSAFKGPDEVNNDIIIHGQTTEGELITLTDCFVSNFSSSHNQIQFSSESYSTNKIYIGNLVDNSTKFYKMTFSTQSLEKWTSTHIDDSPGSNAHPLGPTYVEGAILDDADITLGMWENVKKPMPSYPEPAYLSVWLESPQLATDLLNDYLVPLRNFLTFGIGEMSFPTSITLYTNKYGSSEDSIEFYHHNNNFRKQTDISHHRMDFTLQDIDFERSVANWFNSFSEYSRLHYQFFGTEVNPDIYEDMKFLYYIFGLESYHRKNFPQYYMDKDIYARLRDSIISKIPNVKAKKRMSNMLRNLGNEYSFKDRLMDIFSHHEALLSPIFDIEETAKQARDLRTNIAHDVGESYDPQELMVITENLRIAAGACLITETTLDESTAQEILQNNYRDISSA